MAEEARGQGSGAQHQLRDDLRVIRESGQLLIGEHGPCGVYRGVGAGLGLVSAGMDIGKTIYENWDGITETVGNAVSSGVDFVTDTASSVSDAVGNAADTISDGISDVASSVSDGLGRLGDAFGF